MPSAHYVREIVNEYYRRTGGRWRGPTERRDLRHAKQLFSVALEDAPSRGSKDIALARVLDALRWAHEVRDWSPGWTIAAVAGHWREYREYERWRDRFQSAVIPLSERPARKRVVSDGD